MPFTHPRTVRFPDTDAAGVVYFANVLSICHEAYEASLAASGINLKLFFNNPTVAIPIVHATVNFFRPMFCGDELLIHVTPQHLSEYTFEISYELVAASAPEPLFAKALTRHVCIDSRTRSKTPLPDAIMEWLSL